MTKLFLKIVGFLLLFSIIGFGLKLVFMPLWFAHETVGVIQQEIHPKELLRKYEWFKNASASLDAKIATLDTYKDQITQLKKDYGSDASKYPRDVRNDLSQWRAECSGIAASYNLLASDYNAQMAKINWRFTNVGMLPQGVTQPLPREYRNYLSNF